jgi:putative multiple sugar transport system permease protein
MDTMKDTLSKNVRQYGITLALIALILFFQFWTGGKLLLPNNVRNLFQQNAYVIILALGMLMVIIAGHIDLSVGSVVALVGGVVAYLMIEWHWAWPLASLVGLAIGVVVGAWQGFWVAYVRIPAFVVTLAGMLIFRGLAQLVAAFTRAGFAEGFKDIAGGALPGIAGRLKNPFAGMFASGSPFAGNMDGLTLIIGAVAVAGLVFSSLQTRRSQLAHGLPVESKGMLIFRLVALSVVILGFFWILSMSTGRNAGTPIILVLLGVLVLIYSFVTQRTTFGRHTYAVGGNRNAALLSGINTARVDFMLFVNMGLLSALAGIVVTSRANAAMANAGQSYEMDAIASCFIGGTAVTGGIGRVGGAVIGALFMGVLNMGLSIKGIDTNWTMAIKGIVLLFAVAFDLVSKRRGAGA